MKVGKKVRPQTLLAVQKSSSKISTQKNSIVTASSEHRKLMDYRDYLISLRKIDLGSLIQKSNIRKKEDGRNKMQKFNHTQHQNHRNQQNSLQTHYKEPAQLINHTAGKERPATNTLQTDQIKNPQNFTQKIHQLSKSKSPQPKSIFDEIDLNKEDNRTKTSFKLKLNIQSDIKDIKDDELYCDENMDELMNAFEPYRPKLMHISNYQNNHKEYYSHRSSHYRDCSMPSIEERNLSEQSQESFKVKDSKNCSRSNSHNVNERKYNSCKHATSARQQVESGLKQKSKRNSIVQLPLTARSRDKLQTVNIVDKENLVSTQDMNSHSGNKSARQRIYQTIKTNPFNIRSQFNKQQKKLQLNVCQIVKRINSRQSKSSMSDRSYRQNQANVQVSNNSNNNNIKINKKDLYDQYYGNEIKEKMLQVSCDSLKVRDNAENGKNEINRKSFKTQVKQFRQKHYLIMKLCQ